MYTHVLLETLTGSVVDCMHTQLVMIKSIVVGN